ncbi:hypothetical protein IBTHAUMO2_790019 [Nitrosopumilaceae archaeon]|nr:hypothetical protein IBTHAUMO2_790019 [Nitrosopumilaceae archaeon]
MTLVIPWEMEPNHTARHPNMFMFCHGHLQSMLSLCAYSRKYIFTWFLLYFNPVMHIAV